MIGRLILHRVPGEASGELVYRASFGGFSCWVKHEYSTAPWEWILMEGTTPVAFGDAADRETAEFHLFESMAELCPEFAAAAPPVAGPGLARRLWRVLW